VGRGNKQAGRSRGASSQRRPWGASIDADLDLLLIAVYCTADDLLPRRPENAKRILTPSSGRPPDPNLQRRNDTQITRDSLKTNSGPSDCFTGTVYIDPIAAPSPPSRTGAASVHFTRVPARRGTLIRSVRRSTSPRASAAASARGAGRRDRPGRPGLLRARREPLARRRARAHDPHRHAGGR
jgi:hypothetical protein